MTVHEFLAAEDTADALAQRRDTDDDDALHEAFALAAENHGNDGADRLRCWALESYS